MMNLQIVGLQVLTDSLNKMARSINPAMETLLDKTAEQAKEKMAAEAPKGLSRQVGQHLAETIEIVKSDTYTREIIPGGRNFSPGNMYALAIEQGSRAGYIPNVLSIEQYFGVDRRVAWAIALKLKDKGTPANPFVKRTFDWLNGQLDSQLSAFLMTVTGGFS